MSLAGDLGQDGASRGFVTSWEADSDPRHPLKRWAGPASLLALLALLAQPLASCST